MDAAVRGHVPRTEDHGGAIAADAVNFHCQLYPQVGPRTAAALQGWTLRFER
jgi:hypothetical protein